MINSIPSFATSQMTIGVCLNFHQRVVGQIEAATPQALHVESKYAAYAADVEKLQAVVNRQRGFVATQRMREADNQRDNAVGVILSVVRACLTSAVAEKRQAAAPLSVKLSAYKGINKHMYAKQTSEVKGMLGVLGQPENAAGIAVLGLVSEVEALREANNVFDEEMEGKTDEKYTAAQLSAINSAALMQSINSQYATIVQIVNVMAMVHPSEAITQFIVKVSGYVSTYAAMVSGTPGTSETPTPETPETPTPGENEGGETPETPTPETPETPTPETPETPTPETPTPGGNEGGNEGGNTGGGEGSGGDDWGGFS